MTQSGMWNKRGLGPDDGEDAETGMQPRNGSDGVAAALGEVSRRLHALLGEVAKAPARAPAPLRDSVARIDSRLDALAAEGRGASETPQHDLHRRLTDIAKSIEAMGERVYGAGEARPADRVHGAGEARPAERVYGAGETRPAWPAALDAAVAEIQTRQRTLDARPAGASRPARPDVDPILALRRDIFDLSRALGDVAPRQSVEALDASVRALQAQIEADRAEARAEAAAKAEASPPPPIDIAQLNELTSMLIDVREGVRTMQVDTGASVDALGAELKGLSERLDGLDKARLEPTVLQHIISQIGELRSLLGQAMAGSAGDGFAEELHQLAAKVDRISGVLDEAAATAEMLESLERKLDRLADSIAAGGPGPATGVAGEGITGEGMAEILDRLDRLQAQFETSAHEAPAVIERSILLLVDKLDRIQGLVANGADPGALGLRLDEMSGRLEKSDGRLNQLDAIENTVNELFAHIETVQFRTIDAVRAALRDLPASVPVEDLTRDLSDLRMAHRDTELRTNDTLESVHATLERVIDRLAMLEEDLARRTEAPAEPPATLPPSPAPATATAAPLVEAEAAPSLPPDLPLEPGSRTPFHRGPAVLPPGPKGAPEPNSKASFIAAARRAAQQASADGDAKGGKPGDAAAPGGLRAALAKHRTLVLAAVVLLMVAASAPVLLPAFLSPPPEPAAVETPAPLPLEDPSAPSTTPAAPAPHSRLMRDSIFSQTPTLGMARPDSAAALAPFTPEPLAGAVDPTGSIGPRSSQAAAPAKPDLPAAIGPQALREAALAGDLAAMVDIGTRYAEGRGVAQSFGEAARWFESAALKGSMPAAYRLGTLYEKGQGVLKDVQVARRYYTSAAEAGNVKAMHNLAVLHAEGIDGRPDYREASQWFRRAAERGLRDSQYNLGILYARGLGVDQNMAESFKWFALAAAQGDTDAQKKRDDVAARLDAQALLAARLAVQTFVPKPLDAAANEVPPADAERAEGLRGKSAAVPARRS